MSISSNATELFVAMREAVEMRRYHRKTTDPESPQLNETLEAKPGVSFELRFPQFNVQSCVAMDRVWAIANTLHFFAATEEADALRHYNKHAARFLTEDGHWRGAYGAIAMPQVQKCLERLKQHPYSRRAVVSMGAHDPQDINRPACWSFLQFLVTEDKLNLLVYQRSLNLTNVMQYDLIVLTNLLQYAANSLHAETGSLHWTVGSLHTVGDREINHRGRRHASLMLLDELRDNPAMCLDALNNPEKYKGIWNYEP